MDELIPKTNPEQEDKTELFSEHEIRDAGNKALENAGIEITPIKENISEAKAYENWQESRTPEVYAVTKGKEDKPSRKEADQKAYNENQADLLTENPNAITEVPKNL